MMAVLKRIKEFRFYKNYNNNAINKRRERERERERALKN
jgi:hypothetical protein